MQVPFLHHAISEVGGEGCAALALKPPTSLRHEEAIEEWLRFGSRKSSLWNVPRMGVNPFVHANVREQSRRRVWYRLRLPWKREGKELVG